MSQSEDPLVDLLGMDTSGWPCGSSVAIFALTLVLGFRFFYKVFPVLSKTVLGSSMWTSLSICSTMNSITLQVRTTSEPCIVFNWVSMPLTWSPLSMLILPLWIVSVVQPNRSNHWVCDDVAGSSCIACACAATSGFLWLGDSCTLFTCLVLVILGSTLGVIVKDCWVGHTAHPAHLYFVAPFGYMPKAEYVLVSWTNDFLSSRVFLKLEQSSRSWW